MIEYNKVLGGLSEEEKKEALKILQEIYENGESTTLNTMNDIDYDEVPVDIDTFIDSPDYAGWFTGNGKNIYTFWRNKLREIFNGGENYTEIVFTGGIGTGKSHIAVLSLAYCLYKLMCLKDPYSYFNLAKGSFIYIVFFNATLQLSQGVAYSKFQSLLLNSPWFMAHGKMSGTKYLEYIPDKPIRFTVGSQMEHSIGKDIACMTGDTIIFTIDGCKTLESLNGKSIKVYTKCNDGNIRLSEKEVEIVKTKSINEIYEIELEDGTILKCTHDHKLKLKSGEYIEAQDLKENMELDDGIFATSGIYCITNTINNKRYVGKSESNVLMRLNHHKKLVKTNKHLKDAILKYGIENFKFEVLELCSKEECCDRERYWIEYYDSMNSGYNFTTGGEGKSGWHLSQEARDLISKSWEHRVVSDETRKKMSIANKGKKWSEELKRKASLSHMGEKNSFYGKHHTKETKLKIAKANLNPSEEKRKKISETRIRCNTGRVWINNGTSNKFVSPSDVDMLIQNGWVIGRLFSNESKIGKIWINKNCVNKQIEKSELNHYLKLGWNKGMYKRGRANEDKKDN